MAEGTDATSVGARRRSARPAWAPRRPRSDLPTLVVVLVMVIVPVLWTLMLAFQDVRLINLRQTGLFGNYTLGNFSNVLTSPRLRLRSGRAP